jgi:hypothetical protein
MAKPAVGALTNSSLIMLRQAISMDHPCFRCFLLDPTRCKKHTNCFITIHLYLLSNEEIIHFYIHVYEMMKEEVFDVCVIRGGVHSPYSLDGSTITPSQQERVLKHFKNSTHMQKVCVIDGDSAWLESWQRYFASLSIQHLRPARHPTSFFSPRGPWPKSILTSMWSGLICERPTNA